MLSLDKCHSMEEIKKFAAGHDIVASIKLDGISCRLIYQDGELIGAESRGNGTEGNDILQHVKQFMNVPLRINKKGKYVIDGEALIKLDDFEEINKNGEYKNSRNLTAGTLSSLDTSVVKDRKLSWYAWEVVSEETDPILVVEYDSFYFKLLEAEKLGFNIVPCELLKLKHYKDEEIQNKIDNFISLAAEKHLPQDGVVFKFEYVEYGKSLGSTEHHNRNGIAFKVKNDSVETTLKDIEFTMGNHFLIEADEYATKKVHRDFEQGWQGIEYKLNSVGSSRGDYPFVTMTIGLATSKFGKMATITLLNVHKEGQGKNGQIYTVEDRGVPSGCVDIYVGSHSEALNSGMYYAEVRVVG